MEREATTIDLAALPLCAEIPVGATRGQPWGAPKHGSPNPGRDPEAQTELLADHDGAGHRRAVHRAVVLIGPRRGERDGVCLAAAAHDRTARKRSRPLGLDAVGDALVVGPRPGYGGTHRHCVDRWVRGAVVGADEYDSPVVPHGHGPDRPTAPARAVPAATPTPVRAGRRVTAATRERRERDHADDCCA